MKPVITKEEVGTVIAQLIGQGKKPTLMAVHAALGHKGSMSTLVRLKAEIEAEARRAADSSEGLQAFRNVWALARAEGRKEQETAIAELQENLQAVATENERLQGVAAAAETRAMDLKTAIAKTEAELKESRASTERNLGQISINLGLASSQAAKALQELADARSAHAARLAELQNELTAAHQTSHAFELQLVRARAVLEANGLDNATTSTSKP